MIKEKITNIFKRFKITNLSFILIGIAYCFTMDYNEEIFDTIASFLLPLALTSYLVDSIKLTDKKKKIGYILALFLSLLLFMISRFDDIRESFLFIRIVIFLYTTFITMGVYHNYKNSGVTFSNYLISCFSNCLENSIIFTVLTIGTLLIIGIIHFLLFPNLDFDLYEYDMILLFTGYYIPSIFNASDDTKEVNTFIKILISKICFILVTIAYLIIYIYLIKVIVTLNVPKNTMFGMLAALFIIGNIITIMAKDIETNDIFRKINNILNYLYIPLILIEIYSIGIRIFQNGLTIPRYLGVILIIFQIIYTVFIIKKIDIAKLVYVGLIELFIMLLVPFINAETLSIYSQMKYIKEYKHTNKVTRQVQSAYEYITDFKSGRKQIEKYLTNEERKIIEDYYYIFDDEEEKYYYYSAEPNSLVNIEGYKQMKKVQVTTTDLKDYPAVKKVIEGCILEGQERFFDEKNEIIYNDDTKYVIMTADLTYTDLEIIRVYIDMYELTK